MAHVLLVEDDPWIADIYSRWLTADGHMLAHARGAQDALDVIDDRLPQLIILDMLLPGANGVQLLNVLQSHSDLADVPVIVCSASLPDQLPDVTSYGVRRVLAKADLNPARLREAVNQVLAHAAI